VSVYKLPCCHSRENGNPVISTGSGFLLEFTPYLIRGRNDEIIDFMDRLYLEGMGFIKLLISSLKIVNQDGTVVEGNIIGQV